MKSIQEGETKSEVPSQAVEERENGVTDSTEVCKKFIHKLIFLG